ncbi:hypothetical protein Lser_V15G03160 [Lactuca serriola]
MVEILSKSDNYGLPESVGKGFPLEDHVPQLDCGNGNHALLPPPPPIILPDPHVRRLEKFKVTQALLEKIHEDGKSVCAHVLDMKLLIDRLGMLGVDVSRKLAVDLVVQTLPESYGMIWRTGRINLSSKSISQHFMGNGNIGKEFICFYCQKKGHWLRSCPDYLRDVRDGRVKMYESASGSKKREEA